MMRDFARLVHYTILHKLSHLLLRISLLSYFFSARACWWIMMYWFSAVDIIHWSTTNITEQKCSNAPALSSVLFKLAVTLLSSQFASRFDCYNDIHIVSISAGSNNINIWICKFHKLFKLNDTVSKISLIAFIFLDISMNIKTRQ